MFLRGLGSFVSLALALSFFNGVVAFDNTRKDNLAVYWGQDGAGSQQNLAFYCSDDTINVIPLAFLYIFRGSGGAPVVDLGSQCSDWNTGVFSGTDLVKCPSSMAADIKTCQSKGKIITLSLGGATGQVGFSSDSEAQTFADQVWNMFLGGSSSTRPFGDAILDGIDLDIESGTAAHYAAFVNRIRSHASGASKKYFITAAPQCPFPDEFIGDALNGASFDAIYVQFYNNFCGLNHQSDYNFATWDNWAKTKSPNKSVKIYIGAPGSPDAAGEGYVDPATLAKFAVNAQKQFSSFGGVMLWDADSAHSNNRFDKSIKSAMVASAKQIFQNPDAAHTSAAPIPASTSTKNSTSTQGTKPPNNASGSKDENNDSKDIQDIQDSQDTKTTTQDDEDPPSVYSRFFRF